MRGGYPLTDLEQSLPPLRWVWHANLMPKSAPHAHPAHGDGPSGEEKIGKTPASDVVLSSDGVWLVSACLLGTPCRYDGETAKPTARAAVQQLPPGATIIPCCPEEKGGLSTPRPAAHLLHGDGSAVLDGKARVVTHSGVDVTDAFIEGAQAAATLAAEANATHALLKARSPSCGCGRVYLSRGKTPTLSEGDGVTAALLRRRGLRVIDDESILAAKASQAAPQALDAQPTRKRQ